MNAIRVATAASIQDTSDAGSHVDDTDRKVGTDSEVGVVVVIEVVEEPETEKATPESTTP